MLNSSSPVWKERKALDENLKPFLLQFGPLLGRLLWSRGFESPGNDRTQAFLNPSLSTIKDPNTLLSMPESIERLWSAIKNQERVCLYSDYDMDGIGGLTLLHSFLKHCGVENLCFYQPHRFDEGYGFHAAAVEKLAKDGVQLILTIDTGTTALDAVAKANELGIDVIITDHHQPGPESPKTPYLINPNLDSDNSGLGYLSGTGVAFYLAVALRQKMRESSYFNDNRREPDLRRWLDIFCLGTVGDVVDLVEDNRPLILTGLEFIKNTHRPGLRCLLENCLSTEALSQITTRDLAFSVIPKLNAASRMGQAELSTQLLLTEDYNLAGELVEKIMELNEQRSSLQNSIFEEASLQSGSQEGPVLVTHGEWHEGVLGIVASKLVEQSGKPSIVLSKNEEGLLRGSMRCPQPYNCLEILRTADEILIQYGGHQAAAGMQLKSENVERFKVSLNQGFEQLYLSDGESGPQATELFDGEVQLNDVNLPDISQLKSAEPFGAGNPEASFLIKNIPISKFEILKERHIKAKTSKGRPAMIGFFLADSFLQLKHEGIAHVDLLATPEINTFRGRQSPQLRINSLRASEPQA